MHILDGYLDAATSVGAGVVATAAIALCLDRAKRHLDERTAPLAGLTAAYIFAVQMLNFPVAAGTSGHLLGGTLAAILVGPWVAVLAVTVVLLVQALLFADGGLTALGCNVVNMALVTVLVGWVTFRLLTRVLRHSDRAFMVAAGLAAFVSVPAAALSFSAQYALGGTGTYSVGQVLAAMTGVHVLIGIGEGLITALTLGAVLASRPDLVFGVRDRRGAARLPATVEVVPAGGRS